VSATATPDRLRLASEQAGTGAADARILTGIHEMVLRLILIQQIEDIAAGIPPSNTVDTTRLGRDQRKTLKRALERLEPMADMVEAMLG
jgi:DNA polymerase-3 subunit epsilon/CBS domain-containing protein